MPNNFTQIAFKYIGGYVAFTMLFALLNYLLVYLFKESGNFTGMSFLLITLSFANYIIFGLALGYGLRELLRNNNYSISLGSVFLFAALMAAAPTVFGMISMYVQSFSNEFMATRLTSEHIMLSMIFGFLFLFAYALFIIVLVGRWLVYKKAGKTGWYSIVPILNTLTMIKMIKKPESLFFLLLVPLLNIIVYFQILNDLAFAFKKSSGFAVGLFFLPFIFFPILGFGDAQYRYGDYSTEPLEMNLEDHLVSS